MKWVTNYLTIQQAADLLRVSPKTIRRRLASGVLRGFKMGTSRTSPVRLDEDEVLALLQRF